MKMAEDIDWGQFSSNYLKWEAGRQKHLKITAAKMAKKDVTDAEKGTTKTLPALEIKVMEGDEEKLWKPTSRFLISALKPVIEAGLPQEIDITQFGTGFTTNWEFIWKGQSIKVVPKQANK